VIRLFRVIVPVKDIERASRFYAALLGASGSRVSPGRHYFSCGDVILACFDPRADGDPWDASPNPEHLYFSVPDLEGTLKSAGHAGAHISRPIETQPWGERSFYCTDPFGNKLCFVAADTLFTAQLLS
jgi:predicted enzyme related to lactoylglutathione lyase